jgi:hypothetical protein
VKSPLLEPSSQKWFIETGIIGFRNSFSKWEISCRAEKNDAVTVCSTPAYNYGGLTQVNNKVEFELGDDVFFADNSWTFDDKKSDNLKKMIDEMLDHWTKKFNN